MNRSRGLTTLAVVLLIAGAILLIVGIAMNGRVMFGELQGGGYGYGYWDGTEEIVPGIIMLAAGAAIFIIRYVLANKAKSDMAKADDQLKQQQLNEAEKGDIDSLFLLGARYYDGSGVEKNPSKAAEYWTKAAENGHAGAMFRIGELYEIGVGVEKDELKALEFYRNSEAKGNKSASVKIGEFYRDGKGGLERNPGEAFRIFDSLTKAGVATAIYDLGLAYLEGIGCEKNIQLAKNYINRAAQADVAGAAEKLKSIMNQQDDNAVGAAKISAEQDQPVGNSGIKSSEASEERTVLLNTAKAVLVDSAGKEIEIAYDSFTIGRSAAKSNYVINSPLVSSAHAQITKKEGNIFIKDLNSSNHTYINGTWIGNEDVMLHNGDVIRLAKEEFKVNIG